jgi:hypothetical protein
VPEATPMQEAVYQMRAGLCRWAARLSGASITSGGCSPVGRR